VISSTNPHDSYAAVPQKIALNSNDMQTLSSAATTKEHNDENPVM
jgi:hypothetical protein